MARAFALLVAASLLALPFAAEAKGGKGGGRGCASGHGGGGHAGSGSSWMFHSAAKPYSTGAGAGYVREDGTYVQAPLADCTPDRPCEPKAVHTPAHR